MKSHENEVNSLTGDAVQSEKRLSFLCPYHRDWVYFNSREAFGHLEQLQVKGEILLEHNKWLEAIPFIGSAWETAEILLQLYSGEKTFLVNRFGVLTVFLCTCLEKLKHKECAGQICHQARSALTIQLLQLREGSDLHSYLMGCIEQLKNPDRFQVYVFSDPQKTTNTLH